MAQRKGETREEYLARQREDQRRRREADREGHNRRVRESRQKRRAEMSEVELEEVRAAGRESSRRWRSRQDPAKLRKRAADYARERRQRDPEKHNEARREMYRLRRSSDSRWVSVTNEYKRAKKYGLTVAELRALLEESEGRCGLCGQESRALHVDHRHDNGHVRGLLCVRCNAIVAVFDLDPAFLHRALKYARQGGANNVVASNT